MALRNRRVRLTGWQFFLLHYLAFVVPVALILYLNALLNPTDLTVTQVVLVLNLIAMVISAGVIWFNHSPRAIAVCLGSLTVLVLMAVFA